ncbi:hypothetical protein C8R46DRAFT_1234450 [Mycena filopes]|nr:hypothetical protein C8R46DRAFT_1234450 [Mycena filopes]
MSPLTPIPIIDLALPKDEAVEQIRRACETLGVFYVKNHGIPEKVISDALAASAEFFCIGQEAKLKMWQEEPVTVNVGYRPPRNSKLDSKDTEDHAEGLVLKWEEDTANGSVDGGNKWPADLPAGRRAVMECYARELELGATLYGLIALAMGKEDFFADKIKANLSRMRLLRYPEQKEEVTGAGAHTDFGTFTILIQEPDIEALQVDIPGSGWTFVPPVPGTVLVNLGDQTSICTNGAFASALHRVVSRPGPVRHSIPLFFMADPEAVLQPDESFITVERPRRYEPMNAGEQFAKRVRDAFAE